MRSKQGRDAAGRVNQSIACKRLFGHHGRMGIQAMGGQENQTPILNSLMQIYRPTQNKIDSRLPRPVR